MTETTSTEVVAAPSMDRGVLANVSLDGKLRYAQALAESGLLPGQYRRQPANLLFAIEYGQMLGIAPMAAVNGIHVIDGKPTASSALMSALVRRAGHKLRVSSGRENGELYAVAQVIRSDDPEFTFESRWSMGRAQAAGLTGKKGPWQQYPEAMLKARAISEVCREACEEALCGVHYTPEELGAVVDADENVVVVVEPAAPVIPDGTEPVNGAKRRVFVACGNDPDAARQVWDAFGFEVIGGQFVATAKVDELIAVIREEASKAAAEDVVDAEVIEERPAPQTAAAPAVEFDPNDPLSTYNPAAGH